MFVQQFVILRMRVLVYPKVHPGCQTHTYMVSVTGELQLGTRNLALMLHGVVRAEI